MSALQTHYHHQPMKSRTAILSILIAAPGLIEQAFAQSVFQAVGDYPALSASGPIEFEATTDTGIQLSHATFSSAVTTAFANNTGGVLDYESENKSASTIDAVVFGIGGQYKLSFNQVFNTTGTAGRTPTSGNEMTSFGSATPTITLGSIRDASGSVISDRGVTQVGFAVLSRNDYAATFQATANFSGGGNSVASRLIGQSAGGQDTFFGFQAPDGESITRIDIAMTKQGGGAAFLGLDDFGFVTGMMETRAPRTHYVSNTGLDTNPGTAEQPFKTIQRAANVTIPGDTVFVLEGTYRERVAPPRGGTAGSEIVYRGEPGKKVIIKGSDVWSPNWNPGSGTVFHAVPDEAMFNDDSYVDDKNPFKVAVSSTPYGLDGKPEVDRGFGGDPNLILSIGQVFVNGKLYTQKGYLSQTVNTSESWYYDRASGAIHIHFPDAAPASHVVEISTRRRIFAPHLRGLGHIVVEGFIMEHCGNQYPTNFWEATQPQWQQAGALGTRSGHHWVIRNNMIRFAHGVGIDFGNEGNRYVDLETGNNGEATGSGYHVIDSNYITDNGSGGTAAYFPRNITFTNNVVERNNNLFFRGAKRWESAGVKMHGPNASVISNNLIRNNHGKWGLWLDQGSGNGTQVHGNLITGHEVGFDLEIGTAYQDKLILDHNVLINNQTGIASREAGGITALNNLIVNSSAYGVHNTINKNREGTWTADHHYYFNNVLIGCAINMGICPPDFYRSSVRQFDDNIYQENSGQSRFKILNTSHGFSDWKTQWSNYNASSNADLNSMVNNQLGAVFDPVGLTMQLNVNEAFFLPDTRVHPKVTKDYFGQPIPGDGSGLPGPFQDLNEGENELIVWTGLKPLAAYGMPDFATMAGIPLHWLREHDLPTDGSADHLDSDGDGQSNLAEWIAGTDPRDPGSSFQAEISTDPGSQINLRWHSVLGRHYSVYRSFELTGFDWVLVHGPVEVTSDMMITLPIAMEHPRAFYSVEVAVLD